MVSGFPPEIARATGFSMAPGRRIQLGFSVLALLLSVYLVSWSKAPIRVVPLLAVFAVYARVSALVGVQPDAASQFRGPDRREDRRVGETCVRTWRYGWSRQHKTK